MRAGFLLRLDRRLPNLGQEQRIDVHQRVRFAPGLLIEVVIRGRP